jgi:uncharacterized protein (TIGR03435 family)
VATILLASQAFSQTTPARERVAFDVVSIKHSGNFSDVIGVRAYQPFIYRPNGTRYSYDGPLGNIISEAFIDAKPSKISGPPWIRSEWYEVQAIFPKGTPVTSIHLMLRTMLEDRLGMKWRWEEKEAPIYALVSGGGPLKLEPAPNPPPKDNAGRGGPGIFIWPAATLDYLGQVLSSDMKRQVLNMTGLHGKYRFNIDSTPYLTTHSGWDPNEWFAILKALGLKLESSKANLKSLVVDHLNLTPTPN